MKLINILLELKKLPVFRIPGLGMVKSGVYDVSLPLKTRSQDQGFTLYQNFSGSTPHLWKFSSHNSVLMPGVMPHPLHSHLDEEILILIEGELEIHLVDNDKENSPVSYLNMKPMDVLHYPAFCVHTIKSIASDSAQYCVFRWSATSSLIKCRRDAVVIPAGEVVWGYRKHERGFRTIRLFDMTTSYLDKLHCHISYMGPGDGYAPHSDPYDVAIIVLNGELETLGRKAAHRDVIFYSAGDAHGMKNTGDDTAVYIVFEFHRSFLRPLWETPFHIVSQGIRRIASGFGK